MNKKLIYLFVFLVLISFAYSAPAIKSISSDAGMGKVTGLFFDSYKYGEDIEFEWHYINTSGIQLNSSKVNCSLHLYSNLKESGNYAGRHIFVNNNVNTTSNKWDWEQKITYSNFSNGNLYKIYIACDDGKTGGFYEQTFFIGSNVNPDEEIVNRDAEYNNMILVMIAMIILYFTMGIINHGLKIKIFSLGFGILQILILYSITYAEILNINVESILRINFYANMIIGFGIAMIGIILYTIDTIKLGKDEEEEKWEDNKWK
jgi:hypothetical protein